MRREAFLQRVLDAAQAHGEQSDPDHEVGDLQGIAWELWELLTPAQKRAFKHAPRTLDLIEQWGSG